jgi:hypothetical protein
MVSPIDPIACLKTNRMLTEWFEYPEISDVEHRRLIFEREGLTFEEGNEILSAGAVGEHGELAVRLRTFIGAQTRVRWKGNMSKQETAMRLNEATKMVDPANFKFLDPVVKERTGLELNPLWMMETIVRAGILSPKDQIAALKELASYTHSKAPTINQNTLTVANPEDWLLDLAQSEYKVIGSPGGPELPYENVKFEKGGGSQLETTLVKRRAAIEDLTNRGNSTMAEYEAMMEMDDNGDNS